MAADLQTLGELQLCVDGLRVDLPRSKSVRALLAYLALHTRPVAREKLCDLFFARTADPRASLRWALSKIRAALGAAADTLVAERDAVGIDPDGLTVDLLELHRLIDSGADDDRLADLATGEPALADARLDNNPEYEAWRIATAGEAVQIQKMALYALLSRSDDRAGPQLVLAARLAALDVGDPAGHVAHVTALVDCGRRQEAEQIYHNARRLLSEFGTDDPLVAAWHRLSLPAAPAQNGQDTPMPEIAQQAQLTADVLSRPAVAVLPFTDLGPAGGDAYLGDSLASEVIAGLSAWRLLPVISRNTTFLYKDKSLTAAEIGTRVGAQYVLAGTVRRAGSRLRLTVELVESRNDRLVWSTRFDGDQGEIFDIEDELVARVVQSVMPQLETAERQRLLRKRPEDYDAWDHAMRAHWLAHIGGADAYDEAVVEARKAARMDPGFGLPHSVIAFVRFQQAMKGWSLRTDLPFREVFRATLDAAHEALGIEPSSWMAHALTGVGELWTNRSHHKAADHLDRAIKLNPSGSWSYHFNGCILGFNGVLDQARTSQTQLFRIDPAYPYKAVAEADLALWNMLDGDLDAAQQHIERSQEADPDYVRGVQRLAALHGLRGNDAEAARAVQRLAKMTPAMDRAYLEASYPFKVPEHREIFVSGLQRAGINIAD